MSYLHTGLAIEAVIDGQTVDEVVSTIVRRAARYAVRHKRAAGRVIRKAGRTVGGGARMAARDIRRSRAHAAVGGAAAATGLARGAAHIRKRHSKQAAMSPDEYKSRYGRAKPSWLKQGKRPAGGKK